MLRLPRRQVDTLHPDVRSLVLQFQLSLGATKQGAPMPRLPPRVPKKVLALPLPPPPDPPRHTVHSTPPQTHPPLSSPKRRKALQPHSARYYPHPPDLLPCTHPELPPTPHSSPNRPTTR